MGFPASPASLPPFKKVKVFTYGVILLKFETQQFHMCTNNNHILTPPPRKKKSRFLNNF